MIAAIDFDGTLVEHEYPMVGAEVEDAFRWLHYLHRQGVKLMLWTMRSGQTLEDAVRYCRDRGVTFWGLNENPEQTATGWSLSAKQYAHVYVDDAALGAPLTIRPGSRRPTVDWSIAGPAVCRTFGIPLPEETTARRIADSTAPRVKLTAC